MPAPETILAPRSHDNSQRLGHVNLMVDTFIANAHVDDLRAVVRGLLATGPPHLAAAFTNAARSRLRQTHAKTLPMPFGLFARRPSDGSLVPTSHLTDTLARARALYGAGMGFASLGVLATVVNATIGMRWTEDSDMANALAVVDGDISQAIQSSKEELDGGRVQDLTAACDIVRQLQIAVTGSLEDVEAWGGEFPFERAAASISYWKF